MARQVRHFRAPVPGVRVIEPGEPGLGQYYPSYCQQWMTWLVSNNPESHNYGPVRFLHCVQSSEGENSVYGAQPVVRIGTQSVSIGAGNFVFLPIITSAYEPIDNGVPDDPTTLLNYVRADIAEGDNPPDPEQATIVDATNINPAGGVGQNNMEPIVDSDLERFLIITDVFPLDVPPAQPGARLLRTSFDTPIATEGIRNCRVGGYWILLQFITPQKRYYIRSFAKGRPPYDSGMLYEINVGDSVSHPVKMPRDRKTTTNDQLKRMVEKLSHDGQVHPDDKKIIDLVLS